MSGIVGSVALLTVLFLSLLITRLAAVALKLTGLSAEVAKFQARSAFTGTGFTTSETEKVVSHPVRRRIVMVLMVTRSAGLITIVMSLILSFANADDEKMAMIRLLWLVVGVLLLWLFSMSAWVEKIMNAAMEKVLRKWTNLDTLDYVGLLNLEGEYSVRKLTLGDNDWLVGKKLADCELLEEGITVLGIHRDNGNYVGAPQSSTDLYARDVLVLYGRKKRLDELADRQSDASGEAAHHEAINDQKEHVRKQDREEAEHRRRR